VVDECLRRVPDFELDPDTPSQWLSAQVGGMHHVPVRFAPGEAALSVA
jgi:hypothetical protein